MPELTIKLTEEEDRKLQVFANHYTGGEKLAVIGRLLQSVFQWRPASYMEEVKTLAPTDEGFRSYDGPPCTFCGTITYPSGRCYLCPQCGQTTGCG